MTRPEAFALASLFLDPPWIWVGIEPTGRRDDFQVRALHNDRGLVLCLSRSECFWDVGGEIESPFLLGREK